MDINVLGNGFELLPAEVTRISRIRIVQVDGPGGRGRAILVHDIATQIVLLQNIVPQQTTRLPLTGDRLLYQLVIIYH